MKIKHSRIRTRRRGADAEHSVTLIQIASNVVSVRANCLILCGYNQPCNEIAFTRIRAAMNSAHKRSGDLIRVVFLSDVRENACTAILRSVLSARFAFMSRMCIRSRAICISADR